MELKCMTWPYETGTHVDKLGTENDCMKTTQWSIVSVTFSLYWLTGIERYTYVFWIIFILFWIYLYWIGFYDIIVA